MEKVIVIVGPTASGKTDYAISLAKKLEGEIISADSRQLYAGMNIGTAKPPLGGASLALQQGGPAEEAHDVLQADVVDGIPHFLFNVASPDKPWTLPQWQAAAKRVLEDIFARGKQPMLVGGTMLYVDSIVKNFSIPTVEPDQALRDALEQEDAPALYGRLMKADPAAGNFIEPHHKQRIIRALEVIEKTGKPFSASRLKHDSPYEFEMFGLFPRQSGGQASWDIMKERISARAKKMFEAGLLEETAALREKYGKDLPLLQTMNYKQAGEVLDGEATLEDALEETIRVNMKYAKRQMAWWKNRSEIIWK
ncbi:MAG: tRNA (adenosine(37)-N6)-dimethylallyltransferase MiaA [Candidatus Andersenbacteria bacterium]|nr:tRNA (adenosine(37)-N6)-dimethylallyltransferase MiaA [Candidatus Andersenbacteria bacterium]